ncbi:hypothetical protein [Pseudonocardia cypriaca]|uniref:Subtilisin inhibitor-like n=1 Tax=Pseudonocardia cypriaca TaxID=882449 RepID=A0A543FQN9_9PSEU|nr:hypothetical protein [Pseudonocardia cypriaca]TQM36153.1 hypothetical protein FB388_7607 [Pseudonocardia cypriaca]
MRNLAHRAGRLAIVPVLAGATMFGVATPAVAAPPAPQPEPGVSKDCSESVGDGIIVCLVVEKPDPETTLVSAAVESAFGDLKGAIVVLEACDSERCSVQEVATGENTAEVRTKPQEWGRGTGYYRANASMVGHRNDLHSGVVHPGS